VNATQPVEPVLTKAVLAQAWAKATNQTTDPPLSEEMLEQLLVRLIDRLVTAVTAKPVDERAAIEVAAELVAHELTGSQSIGRSFEVLAHGLPRLVELRDVSQRDAAVLRMLAALVNGYAEALRRHTSEEQELVTQALLRVKQEELRVCEARFREVLSASVMGIAISLFDGTVITANRAFADIVGRAQVDLIGASLPELLQAEDDATLAAEYRRLTRGELPHFRHRRQFTATTGEVAWTHLGGSVLHDADGAPTHHLTMVENITEVHLLQQELSNQALHDVLTGLPNEQYLMSRLQRVLEGANPSTLVTLYRINLDNFAVINDGLGRVAGEVLLRSIASRLSDLIAEQQAMVARMGADDFAILIEHGPGSPDPSEFAASINEVLCEPVYLDDRGLAVSASVGVVHRHARGNSPAELLRAADATLHRAKRIGSGQWDLYDAQADARERQRYQLAAEMPGGFEVGEITLRYQPEYGLINGWIVALQVLLCWDRPDGAVIDHSECLALAELSPLGTSLGQWMVKELCIQQRVVSACATSGAPRMRVDLTARLSQDPDLIAVLNTALDATGLRAEDIRLGVPLAALARGRGDVVDNVRVLAAELGVEVVLLGAASGPGYLAYLEDFPLCAVEIAPDVVSRIAQRPGDNSVLTRAIRQTIPLVHSADAIVIVPGIDTPEQAQWWRDAGADAARGAHFGPPVQGPELPDLLTPNFRGRIG
jgi:diguanylate cyclase (GGDEF)-like protein/PAS domain S-box-containing protein